MKFKALLSLLMVLLIVLSGCADATGSGGTDSSGGESSTDDSGASAKTIKIADNIYGGYPDIPPAGDIKYTSLSQLVLDNIDPDEEMYFIVGVTSAADKTTEWKGGSFYDHVYEGTLVSELMQREGWQTDPEGKPRAQADYYSTLYGEDYIPGSAKYLEGFGIELCCRPYSYDWQYHLCLISQASMRLNYINGTMSYLVKCTKRELDTFAAENDKYGMIFYISDSEGRYIYCNDDMSRPDVEERMERKDIPIAEEYKESYKPHIFYSFDDAGIYTDLIYTG